VARDVNDRCARCVLALHIWLDSAEREGPAYSQRTRAYAGEGV